MIYTSLFRFSLSLKSMGNSTSVKNRVHVELEECVCFGYTKSVYICLCWSDKLYTKKAKENTLQKRSNMKIIHNLPFLPRANTVVVTFANPLAWYVSRVSSPSIARRIDHRDSYHFHQLLLRLLFYFVYRIGVVIALIYSRLSHMHSRLRWTLGVE